MKILAISDFHGKIPSFLPKVLKKENPDLIVSVGDFSGSKRLSKFYFKYIYGKGLVASEVVSKKKAHQFDVQNLKEGLKVIKALINSKKLIITISGNWDPTGYQEISQSKQIYIKKEDWLGQATKKFRNFKMIDYSVYSFKDVVFVGYTLGTFPGIVSKERLRKYKKLKYSDPDIKDKIRKINRDYKIHYKKLDALFKKARKLNKPIIFLSHNVPYQTKLDLIGGKAHKLARNQHYGSFLVKKMIRKYQPELCICGHIHETHGIQKLGKTIVVNSGASYEKRYAIININGKKLDVKIIKCQ